MTQYSSRQRVLELERTNTAINDELLRLRRWKTSAEAALDLAHDSLFAHSGDDSWRELDVLAIEAINKLRPRKP